MFLFGIFRLVGQYRAIIELGMLVDVVTDKTFLSFIAFVDAARKAVFVEVFGVWVWEATECASLSVFCSNHRLWWDAVVPREMFSYMPFEATACFDRCIVWTDPAPVIMVVGGSRWRALFSDRSTFGEVVGISFPKAPRRDGNGMIAEGERRLTDRIGGHPVIADIIVALKIWRCV